MTVKELAERYAEKPTEARYEALIEKIFHRECTTKGVIWYSALEDIVPVFCDHYKCSECPIGYDVCDRANKGQIELERALRRELNNLGFEGDDVQYFSVTREELRDAIKAKQAESEVEDAIFRSSS